MTSTLLLADPAMIAVVLGCWIWAGLRAGSLPYAASARQLSGRAGRVLALISVGLALILVRVCVVGALASANWWFAQEKVVLSLPLLLAAATVTAVATVPRLLALRSAASAFNGVNTVPPALRHEAAHPLVAWPVQLTAYAAAASEIVFFFVSYPATAGSSLAVVAALAVAGAVTWWLLARRHARLADDVIIPRQHIRLLRSTGAITGLTLAAVAMGLLALVVTAPAASARHNAGHLELDLGGGTGPAHHSGPDAPVQSLRTEPADEVTQRFALTARHARVTLASGSTVDALTFNGTVPGPELRVSRGELVEVTLRNADIADGVTIHWHGYDVPNGEDGVAGLTQDAVAVGGEFVYRFRADQVGTYWYHSHQRSYEQVSGGLFGVLVVQPAGQPVGAGLDLSVPLHRLAGGPATLMGSDRDVRRQVEPGQPVRLRLVNAAGDGNRFTLRGTDAAMLALDGTDVVGPTAVTNPNVRLAAGGRADLGFTMPATTVELDPGGGPKLVLTPRSGAPAAADSHSTEIDPLHYGTPAPAYGRGLPRSPAEG